MKKTFPAIAIMVLIAACQKTSPVSSVTDNRTNTTTVTSTLTTLSFSGYTWTVKNSGSSTAGPGPNYWSSSNVWVDSNGYLHLKLSYDSSTSRWNCAEVYSTTSFGYGKYQWYVEGRVDTLDKNVVLGLFNYSGNDGYDEMDIEFSRWGSTSNPILNYTVYPATGSSGYTAWQSTSNFTISGGTYTTHRFTRNADSVVFKGLYGFYNDDTNLFQKATCSKTTKSISTLSMPIHMNLWMFQGVHPSNNKNVEIIIHSFTFTAA
jgi:hypothetical protein